MEIIYKNVHRELFEQRRKKFYQILGKHFYAPLIATIKDKVINLVEYVAYLTLHIPLQHTCNVATHTYR